jgi:hypothetical protein
VNHEDVGTRRRRCEKIGEREKYARAVILSEAKNLALNSFAISQFHRQSEILRFAQDDSEGLGTTGWLIFSHVRRLAPTGSILRAKEEKSRWLLSTPSWRN